MDVNFHLLFSCKILVVFSRREQGLIVQVYYVMSRNAELINKFVSRVGKAEAEPARSLRFWGNNYVTVCFLYYINVFRVKQYGYLFLFANIRIILFSQIVWQKKLCKKWWAGCR